MGLWLVSYPIRNAMPRYERLEAEVDKSLKKLGELTTLQLEIFRSKNYDSFMRMDKDLELAVGKRNAQLAL